MKYVRMSIALGLLVFITTVTIGTRSANAQAKPSEFSALKEDMESLKKDMAEIKKTLAELRQLMTQRPAAPAPVAQAPQAAPAMAKISVGQSPTLGKADAPVTVIEFSDFQCPFCQRNFANTLPTLKKNYVETGKVRYVFRDFPLDSIHPQARKAAEAAHCAGEQGKYWEMHDALFKNQRSLGVLQLKGYARTMGLKEDDFNNCLDGGKFANTVSEHLAAGSAVGVTGTPSFFIAKTTADGTLEAVNIKGAQPFSSFQQIIDRLLEEKKP